MKKKPSGTALREGNSALRENNYALAIEKYEKAIIELPELKSAIEFNISLAQRYLRETTTISSLGQPSSKTSDLATASVTREILTNLKEPGSHTLGSAGPITGNLPTSVKVVLDRDSIQPKSVVARGETQPIAAQNKNQLNHMRGFFDRLDGTGISGWAIDEKKPETAVELSIYVDDIHFLNIQSSHPRKDLIDRKMPGSKAGFQLNWPVGLFNSDAVFDIRFKDTEKSLSKSPKVFPGETKVSARENVRYLDEFRNNSIAPTTVIVPIYNAYEAVCECIESLLKHTLDNVRLLLIDDCSTDPRISALISGYENNNRFLIVRNSHNLGYTCTVNKAIKACEPDDVVLLNSDTVVTYRWLENLRYCAYSQGLVATVTALSDNAGAFNTPEIGVYNPVPSHLNISSYARIVTNAADGRFLQVPTGNGFCMFIRRAAMNKLGLFDEEKFSRGYGEENDFCMRALRSGWKNIVSDKTYVFHKRSQSFQGEKVALMAAGAAQLAIDYPEYRHLTQRFRDVEFTYIRHRVRTALARSGNQDAIPRILYVISTQSGGTPQTNLDLMRSMDGRYKCFLLRCDSKILTLSELKNSELVVLETYALSKPIEPATHKSDEYDRVALDMLYRHSIDMIHIRHIAWHGLGLAEAAKSINLPVIYSSHDFYAACPSLNLLDQDSKYCGGSCTKGSGTCQIGLWEPNQLPALKSNFINRWREMFATFFEYCDVIISTAPSAREIFLSAFPESAEKFVVIPHGRDFDYLDAPGNSHTAPKIKILVPGNIYKSKGSTLIKQIADIDKDGLIEFNFLGNVDGILGNVGIHHGKYERHQFRNRVTEIAPTIGIVFSIWPETYCHTLTEMWACGIPVFGIDVGAVGDRIRESGAGWLVPPEATAAEIYDKIIREVNNESGFSQRADALRTWQNTEGVWNNTSTMSSEYRLIYQELLNKTTEKPVRIGLVIKGDKQHPATAHIRLLQPLKELTGNLAGLDIRAISIDWLLAGGLEKLDMMIIQRDAIPASEVDLLIRKIDQYKIPYIYEIDDLLWGLPESHTDHSIDAAQVKAIKKLATNANLVTTSTEVLAENLKKFNKEILVIPNSHSKSLWLKPIPASYLQRVTKENNLSTDKTRILYMGTKSHASDLKLVVSAFEKLCEIYPDLEIIQIGGGTLLPNARELNVPNDSKTYPEFVTWFRAICSRITIAIAPLEQNTFNASKSDIKMMDYGFGGVPAVYSDAGPYASSIDDGRTGLLARNTTNSWVDAIKKLLSDNVLQTKIREEMLIECLRRSEINTIARPWLAALRATLPKNTNKTAGSSISKRKDKSSAIKVKSL